MQIGDIVVHDNIIGKIVSAHDEKDVFRFLPKNYGSYRADELEIVSDNEVRKATHKEKLCLIKDEYTWGVVVEIHCIGDYQIVEAIKGQTTHYHGYIDYKDIHVSYPSLDTALIGCIAYKYDGCNTKADVYFNRMCGLS